jgi:hypothetical protein
MVRTAKQLEHLLIGSDSCLIGYKGCYIPGFLRVHSWHTVGISSWHFQVAFSGGIYSWHFRRMTPLITLSDLSLMVFGRRHASAYNFSSITRSNGAWAVVMCSIQQFGTV